MNFLISRKLLDTRNMPELPDVTYFQKTIPNKSGFLFGSIEDMGKNHAAKRVFYNLKVSEYIGPMFKCCLNAKNSYFKQVCQLSQKDIGKFIKSDSGCKVWTGDILTHEAFKVIKETLPADEMMFIAPYKKLLEEYRFWIINDEIITSSFYSWDNKVQYKKTPEHITSFVESWKDCWSPDWAYVVDVGIAYKPRRERVDLADKYTIGIIEYNCLSTSGFYNANIHKIIQEISNLQRIF